MKIAYDCKLEIEVEAEKVSDGYNIDRYRYRCLKCFEPVYVASGEKKVAHFRHYTGNSHTECELYYGDMDATGMHHSASTILLNNHTEYHVLFNSSNNEFTLEIKFPQKKLDAAANQNALLCVKCIKSRKICNENKMSISYNNFSADTWYQIEILNNYDAVEIEAFDLKEKIQAINMGELTFFGNNKTNTSINAIKINGDTIFTNTKYYVFSDIVENIFEIKDAYKSVTKGIVQSFFAFGKNINFTEIEFKNKTKQVDDILRKFGYCLKDKEKAFVLWPPMHSVNGDLVTCKSTVYLDTTYMIESGKNTNVQSNDISYISNRITKIHGDKRTRFVQANVDITVCCEDDRAQQQLEKSTAINIERKYKVQLETSGEYYLSDGKTFEKIESKFIYLPINSKLIKYISTYPQTVYSCPEYTNKSSQKYLKEVLMYYHRNMEFKNELVEHIQLSSVASSYIEQCKANGKINIRALELIKDGMI